MFVDPVSQYGYSIWLIHLGEYSVLYYPLNFSVKPVRVQSKRPGFQYHKRVTMEDTWRLQSSQQALRILQGNCFRSVLASKQYAVLKVKCTDKPK